MTQGKKAAGATCIQCGRDAAKLKLMRCGACYARFRRGDTRPSKRPRDLALAPELAGLLRSVPGTSPSFPARVFSYVDVTGDCWEWTGTLDRAGYGVIGRGGRGTGVMPAHCAVWELLVGPISPDMNYDHLCRNHPCVYPGHGEIVTPAENVRRGYGVSVLNAKRSACDYGHPLDGIYTTPTGKIWRFCKTCHREDSSARYIPKGPRLVCKAGHEFTPENTYIHPKRGTRNCRICQIDRQRAARAQARQGVLLVPETTERAA